MIAESLKAILDIARENTTDQFILANIETLESENTLFETNYQKNLDTIETLNKKNTALQQSNADLINRVNAGSGSGGAANNKNEPVFDDNFFKK